MSYDENPLKLGKLVEQVANVRGDEEAAQTANHLKMEPANPALNTGPGNVKKEIYMKK